jgi:glycosyltransferase involved in cell wall biosynthesis
VALGHISHQFELYKVPGIEWHWLSQYKRNYGEAPRGDLISKYNIKYVSSFEEGKYDLAILHLDQQCFEESLWERGKGSLYREVNEAIQGIPKIVIMHGTPYYPELFPSDITEENYLELGFTRHQIGCSSELIKKCREAVGDNIMVSNSYQAGRQWGFDNVIIHGLDSDEWWDLPKEPRVVTMISPGGLDEYYDRRFLQAVKDLLDDRDIKHCHITVDASFKNWDEYRNFLGRSLIYFNPTRESPMPRSRSEAMLSGCCVVTTPNQDASEFIKSGENGILIGRNPEQVATIIEGLILDYKLALEMGQKGKETAKSIFNGDRYREEWRQLIDKTINEYQYGKK